MKNIPYDTTMYVLIQTYTSLQISWNWGIIYTSIISWKCTEYVTSVIYEYERFDYLLPLYVVEKSHKSFFYYAIYNIYSRYYLCIWLSSNTTFYVHILSSKYIPLKILTVCTILFIFTFRCYHKSFINISKNMFQKSFTSSMNLWFMKSIRLHTILKKKYT